MEEHVYPNEAALTGEDDEADALVRELRQKAKDADLKQWAQTTLPVLEEHLKLAQTDENIAKNEAKNGTKTSSRSATNKTGS